MLKNNLNVLVGRFNQLKHNVLRRSLWLAKYLFILMQTKLIFHLDNYEDSEAFCYLKIMYSNYCTQSAKLQTTSLYNLNKYQFL